MEEDVCEECLKNIQLGEITDVLSFEGKSFVLKEALKQ